MEHTFDFANFGINGVALAVLIFGLTEAFKEFTGLTGKPVRGFVGFVGVLFVGLVSAHNHGVIGEAAWMWIEIITTALAGGTAAMGFYHYQKKRQNGDA